MLHIVVQHDKTPSKTSHLAMPHSIVKDIIASIAEQINLTTASEDDILIALLSTKKLFS